MRGPGEFFYDECRQLVEFAKSVIKGSLGPAGPASAHTELAEKYGVKIKEKAPEPPQYFGHVWNYFCELSKKRPVFGFGVVGHIPETET